MVNTPFFSTEKRLPYKIRPAQAADINQIAALDARASAHAGDNALIKPDDDALMERRLDHWREQFKRFGAGRPGRHFLVALSDDRVIGVAVGHVCAFEFLSDPSGTLHVLQVDPDERCGGVGTHLFETLCARFRSDGATSVNAMVPRVGGPLSAMAFCRHLGMKAGPYLQFEKSLAS